MGYERGSPQTYSAFFYQTIIAGKIAVIREGDHMRIVIIPFRFQSVDHAAKLMIQLGDHPVIRSPDFPKFASVKPDRF